tara:strand:- start:195 stop:416 length:222 start_codon:yes stop_codon:yes gene_type:complete
MYLSLTTTLIIFGACAGVFVLARWRSGQPVRPERGPRLIPWTFIAIFAAAIGVIMIAHLAELAGLDLSQLRRR